MRQWRSFVPALVHSQDYFICRAPYFKCRAPPSDKRAPRKRAFDQGRQWLAYGTALAQALLTILHLQRLSNFGNPQMEWAEHANGCGKEAAQGHFEALATHDAGFGCPSLLKRKSEQYRAVWVVFSIPGRARIAGPRHWQLWLNFVIRGDPQYLGSACFPTHSGSSGAFGHFENPANEFRPLI